MAIIVTNTGKRSELQEKLAAELREKMARSGSDEGDDPVSRSIKKAPDLVEDSAYVKDYKKSKPIPRFVVILIIAVVIIIVAGLVIALAN